MSNVRLQAKGLLNLDDLVKVIEDGVIGWWNNIQTQPKKKILMHPFKSSFIKDLSKSVENGETNRIITYKKIRLTPGGMGTTPFSGTKERRPRVRENNVSHDGVTGQVTGKWVDVLLRFDCFAPTWSEATKLEEDFENLMDLATGAIMNSGVNKMIFQGSYSETYGMETDYFYEPVTYYFRLEKQYFTEKSILRDVEVNVNNVYQRIINENDN